MTFPLIERIFIKFLKASNSYLLDHAHIQLGVGHNTYRSGEEYVLKTIIKEALKKNPQIVFDVGANSGEYANLIAAQFPQTRIYCFEPVPRNYENLVINTKGLATINVLTAVGGFSGTLQLHMGENNADGAMASAYRQPLETIFDFVGPVETFETPMTTLDKYCGSDIDRIDFLKIDVEGYELEVLKGASTLLSDNRISIIQFEFNEFNIFSRTFIFDFFQVLKDFDMYRIMPQNRVMSMGPYDSRLEIFRYQNILAVHKSLNFKPGK